MLRHPALLPPLSAVCKQQLQSEHFSPMGGGSINEVYRVAVPSKKPVVVKVNSATKFPQLFMQEAKGLLLLQPYITTPQVLAQGEIGGLQFLVLECIAEENPTPAFWKIFGAALAALHSVRGANFGGTENNYMGAVPQDNTDTPNWSDFFAQRRLLPLASQCAAKGLLNASDVTQVELICQKLPQVFSDAPPTLLHGDLWSGNFLCGSGAVPVLIDPAVYYGHPSVDMGMTTLFGGFHPLFYESYHYHKPPPPNYKDEWQLCNLYPLSFTCCCLAATI